MGPDATWWTEIRDAAAGKPEARDAFARRYEPVVRAYLLARWAQTPVRDDVDDAVQDVFVECFRQGGALERADAARGSFRPYLYGVVRNVARRAEAKRAQRRDRQPGSGLDLASIPDDEDSATTAFERAWASAMMRDAAERQAVRAQERGAAAVRRVELLRLRFEEGLPIRGIAARWEADPAWVHHEYARARNEFRQAILEVVTEHNPAGSAEEECARLLDLMGR